MNTNRAIDLNRDIEIEDIEAYALSMCQLNRLYTRDTFTQFYRNRKLITYAIAISETDYHIVLSVPIGSKQISENEAILLQDICNVYTRAALNIEYILNRLMDRYQMRAILIPAKLSIPDNYTITNRNMIIIYTSHCFIFPMGGSQVVKASVL